MLNETASVPLNAAFARLMERAAFTSDLEFRGGYLAHHLRVFLADQIRALRGEQSQREFGELIGKPQSVVSRLEDEDYGKLSLQTLIDIATKLDIGLLVRFVDFPTFLRETNDFSDEASAPASYDRVAINQMLLDEKRKLEGAQAENSGSPQRDGAWQEFAREAGKGQDINESSATNEAAQQPNQQVKPALAGQSNPDGGASAHLETSGNSRERAAA
jgi:transcriptional regulator with XRE-family HTH domain